MRSPVADPLGDVEGRRVRHDDGERLVVVEVREEVHRFTGELDAKRAHWCGRVDRPSAAGRERRAGDQVEHRRRSVRRHRRRQQGLDRRPGQQQIHRVGEHLPHFDDERRVLQDHMIARDADLVHALIDHHRVAALVDREEVLERAGAGPAHQAAELAVWARITEIGGEQLPGRRVGRRVGRRQQQREQPRRRDGAAPLVDATQRGDELQRAGVELPRAPGVAGDDHAVAQGERRGAQHGAHAEQRREAGQTEVVELQQRAVVAVPQRVVGVEARRAQHGAGDVGAVAGEVDAVEHALAAERGAAGIGDRSGDHQMAAESDGQLASEDLQPARDGSAVQLLDAGADHRVRHLAVGRGGDRVGRTGHGVSGAQTPGLAR
jgi:hypothetical protein